MHGKAFDHPDLYTSDELAKLKSDINDLFHGMMSANPVKNNLAVISAGSPGAGKTTLLRQKLQEEAEKGSNYPYVCPDGHSRAEMINYYEKTSLKENPSQKVSLVV